MNLMLCEVGSVKDIERLNGKWVGQRKIDGVRCIAVIKDNCVRLLGRNGTDYTNKFREIVEDFKSFADGIYDGEVVCDTFNHTSSRVHNQNTLKAKLLEKQYPATFWLFDKIMNLTNIERLNEIRGINKEHIKTLCFQYDLIGLWKEAEVENWEGIIIKNPNSFYQNKRSHDWLKIKRNKFKDIQFNSYSVNPAGIRLENQDGVAVQVSGSQSVAVKEMLDNTGSCVCEIKYLEQLESGAYRMPTFSKLVENG